MNSSKDMVPKTVCVVGLGIGKLYVSAAKAHGWNIITVDQNESLNADYLSVDDIPNDVHIDMGIICTPNFTHQQVARQLGAKYVTNIVVEKPGFRCLGEWLGFQQQYPKSRLWMVKNNQFRTLFEELQGKEIEKITGPDQGASKSESLGRDHESKMMDKKIELERMKQKKSAPAKAPEKKPAKAAKKKTVAEEAKELDLIYVGNGRYANKGGTVTHLNENGILLPYLNKD